MPSKARGNSTNRPFGKRQQQFDLGVRRHPAGPAPDWHHGSGGTDPDSVTIAGDNLVYVLNADSKTIAGFWLGYRGLRPIPGSVRPLGAGVLVPRQIQFTSDARVLVVDEGGSSTIDTFVVGPDETPGPGGHHAEHLPAPRFIRPNELTVCGASHTETLCSRN